MAKTQFNDALGTVYYTGRDGKQYAASYDRLGERWTYKLRNSRNGAGNEMPKGYTTPDGYNFSGDYAIVRTQRNGKVNQNKTNNQSRTSAAPAWPLFQGFSETADKDGWITNKKGNRYKIVGTTNVFENGDVWDRATGRFFGRNTPTQTEATADKIKVSGASNSISPSPTYSQRMRRSGFNGDVRDFLNFAISLGYRLRGKNNGIDGLFGEDTEKAWKALKDLYNLYKVKNNITFNPGLDSLKNIEEIPTPQPTDIASDYSSQLPLSPLYGKQTLNYKLKQGGTMQNKDKETQEFVTWLKNKYPDITLEKVSQMQEDGSLEKEYKEFQKSKVKKAEHGIKLNYFKSLKNQCDDDEELIYYKRGGTVDCGCVKKASNGTQVPQKPKKSSAVEEFKNKKKLDLATRDSIAANRYNDQEVQATRPGSYKKDKDGKVQWTPDRTKAPYKKACGGSMKKKIEVSAKGAKVCPKCGKVHTGPCKMSCGSKLKKHLNGGNLNRIPFYLEGTPKGGIKRFSYSWSTGEKDKSGKLIYQTKRFDSKQEAEAYRKKIGKPGKITDNGDTSPQVLRSVNNTNSGKYRQQQEESLYNNLSFKNAFAKAKGLGKRWFGYKGKVYDTGLKNAKVNNLTLLQKIYGAYLGWQNDPKFNNSSSRNARAKFRKELDATPNGTKIEKPLTNSQANRIADERAKNITADKFVDAIMPTNMISNFVDMALSRDEYTPSIAKSGFNPFGYARDAVDGNIGNLAVRGVDTYATLGAPGASSAIDKVGVRFAPRISSIVTTTGSKSSYIPKRATIDIVDGSGNVVGKTINKWAQNSVQSHAGLQGTTQFGRRSIQRAAQEGVLEPLSINGGMNNAARYANAAIRNNNTGLTYFWRGAPEASYDVAIDNAMKIAPYWTVGADVAGQELTKSYLNGGSLNGISFTKRFE